ncbi:MAG: amino acid adenylation domain-containing protein [Clostridia bacterium]|nr:amino acid adenylation domain-containing protein [Clostridia bacterium]
MEFKPTSSQLIFYTKSSVLDSSIWNQSLIQVFPKIYTYDQLNDAYNKLRRDHEGLRVKFKEKPVGLVSYVEDYKHMKFPFIKVGSDEELLEEARKFVNLPMDFYGILVNPVIFHTPTKSGIIIYAHHIIVDGYSSYILAEDINRYLKNPEYRAVTQPYAEYIYNEEKHRAGKRYFRDYEFWKNEFDPHTKYSLFSYANNTFDYDSSEVNLRVETAFLKKIKNFCEKSDVSVQSFFNSVYAVYFYKATGLNHFTLGVPVLNRTLSSELNTIGLYMHIVPLVVKCSEGISFFELIQSIENSQLNIFRHQKITQIEIKKALEEKGIAVSRLFDVVADYQEFDLNNSYELKIPYSNSLSFPLEIHMQSFGKENHNLKIRYRTCMFTEQEIETMINSIIAIVEDAIEHPHKKIIDLEMLSAEEKQRVLCDFNDTAVPYPKDQCIHELFETQAEKTPDKVAVVAADKSLSYRELNEQANRIAHSLIEKGIGRGDIVGLMLPRKSYLLSALFGILKTGAAYLPIDPDHPEDRIKYMLSDSGAKLCITKDNVDELLSNTKTVNPVNTSESEDICYCIYTSGSTGKPKGTLITHRNVSNYVSANERNVFYGITGKDSNSILSVTTVGFDIFVTESILPLVNGMEIILADEEQSKIQSKLSELIIEHPVDVLQTTPTKMKAFITDKASLDYLKSFKVIILGGEALDSTLVKELKGYTDAKIYNIYGPTETTVWSAYAEAEAEITIGKPIANTQIYIVDKYLNPVPIGVMGELCIAGASVSAGYLNNPELTAEKFPDNPFGEGKLYRTGDNAYWREDGNIVYVGRSDFQVKIRGLRIELGEIESALQSVEGIDRAAVVVRKDKEDRQLICAFCTGKEKGAKELREELGVSLPKYMIPHIFTHLDEMPMTTSGKINRNGLPEIDLESISTETEYEAPETEKEILLTECISKVLNRERVSVADNFFDIGGDSLKAIELTARLEEKEYTVSVRTIFSCKDIRELAEKLEVKEKEDEKKEYGNVIPATAAQLRVYTAQMMKPDSMMYNVTFAFRTENPDKKQLEKAVNGLIERHESLRTRFENINGEIMQIIEEKAEITVEDISDINSFAKPFELNRAPLIRVGCTENEVVISLHHITVDGESMPVFFKELNDLYMGRKLSDTVQYGEFAVTQGYTEENEKYWLREFAEKVPELNLPTDYPRGVMQSFRGNNLYELIDIHLHRRIEEKSKERGITPYVYYMACFSILLSKLTGNEDIAVGTPISGRQSRYLDTVGMFVNTIALRSTPKGEKTVAELLGEIRDSSIEAIDNQSYPFGELVKKLGINTAGRNPLFDVMLAYQSYEMTDITFADKKAEVIPLTTDASKCDLTFNILPRKEDVVLAVEYCSDLYSEATVRRFIEAYSLILTRALDEETLIRDISALNDKDKNSILHDFNDTAHVYDIPEKSTLYSLFDTASENNKGKVCIKANDKEITFERFKAYAERIDSRVRAITNEEKSVIAVIAERSFEMYGAIYGIIRGGNAYLPIAPDYPQDRIDYILRSSGAAAVVAQSNFCHLSGDIPCIDATEAFDSAEKPKKTLCLAKEDDTAYVIYTSGSTGNPKGAKISHKSAVNRILWMHDFYPLEENDVILQKTPYTFDVSVWEIFWWGITGGTLCVSKPDEHFLPAKILEETAKNKVTHLHFVPSVFDMFLTYLENNKEEQSKFSTVKYVFLSGEVLTAKHVNRFYRIYDYSKVQLHNLYGPTECAVDVSCYACLPTETDPVPIGKPIYNTKLYITDKYMNPVPVGVTGELCIGGMNVGQGYLNNPELTAEKFPDNPFGEGKLYRTGDNAYWREDGSIIFCGRRDSQIKLNGQRIELGEIENTVRNVDGVVQCAVIVREQEKQQFICAFYTGKDFSAKELRSVVSDKLPQYMVPHIFIHLDEMPMTTSGKINRNALPETELINISSETEFLAPYSCEEKALAETVCSVLKINKANMLDNFFNMGGDSIKAIYIASDLEAKGYELRVADIMQSDTLSDIAKVMKPLSDRTVYEQREVNGFIPFTPIMDAYIKENGTVSKDFVHTCVISADCDEVAAQKALDALVSHHDILRGTFCDGGIEIHPSEERRVYSFRSVRMDDENEAKEYLKDVKLSEDKLVSAVFCITAKANLISITIHHFLVDLVSWEILIKDFQTAVEQLKNKEEISLPPKTAPFILWNEELHKYSDKISEESSEYWKRVNEKLGNVKSLCSDAGTVCEAEAYSYVFDKDVSDKIINEIDRIYGVRANEVLLTALGLAACNFAQGSVGIVVESHGRTDFDKAVAVERTVGWFTSCYPVVFDGEKDIVRALIRTKVDLRKVPENGIDYLLLSQGLPENAGIIFNFYRNSITNERNGNKLIAFDGGSSAFSKKIDVNCIINDGIITVNISVPECIHKKYICEDIGTEFVKQIVKIADLCAVDDNVEQNLSDFSDEELTEQELDELKELFDWTDDDEQ